MNFTKKNTYFEKYELAKYFGIKQSKVTNSRTYDTKNEWRYISYL